MILVNNAVGVQKQLEERQLLRSIDVERIELLKKCDWKERLIRADIKV